MTLRWDKRVIDFGESSFVDSAGVKHWQALSDRALLVLLYVFFESVLIPRVLFIGVCG